MSNDSSTDEQLIIIIILFPHISPISRTRGHRRKLPFPYHRTQTQTQTQTKEEKERKKMTDEKTSPDLIGGQGKKIKQDQKKQKTNIFRLLIGVPDYSISSDIYRAFK